MDAAAMQKQKREVEQDLLFRMLIEMDNLQSRSGYSTTIMSDVDLSAVLFKLCGDFVKGKLDASDLAYELQTLDYKWCETIKAILSTHNPDVYRDMIEIVKSR